MKVYREENACMTVVRKEICLVCHKQEHKNEKSGKEIKLCVCVLIFGRYLFINSARMPVASSKSSNCSRQSFPVNFGIISQLRHGNSL